jgi:1,4-dihydroxy-2-naphthoate octaprenyltransferase
MSPAQALLLAARPKTLPAAVCPVVAGSALAWRLEHTFSWLLAAATLLSTLAIQVATNYFNDAVDAAKGADTSARLGPVRATAAGLVSRKTMLLAGCIAALAAALFSVPLIMERGWPIVVIGVISLFFSYGYTGGPWPLAYRGLGEVFVMLFFGLVAVTGTVFVQTGHWRAEGLLLGVQIGALSTALIAINNLRDIEEDRQSGKRTLAVQWGVTAARWMVAGWCLLPYVAGFLWLGMEAPLRWPWTVISDYSVIPSRSLAMLAGWPLMVLPLALLIVMHVRRAAPSAGLNHYLALSGLHLLLWTALFTAACLRSP